MHDLSSEWANTLDEFTYIPVSQNQSSNSDQLRHMANLSLEDFKSFNNVQVYCCGAPGLVQIAFESFVEKGLPEDEFFADALLKK